MKMVSRGPYARFQASLAEVQASGICRHTIALTQGQENLTTTGAKLYYRGGGWWTITGYASNRSDVFSNTRRLMDGGKVQYVLASSLRWLASKSGLAVTSSREPMCADRVIRIRTC